MLCHIGIVQQKAHTNAGLEKGRENGMKDYMLEVCVDSASSAAGAAAGGAKRLELCSSLITGGITPSLSLLREIRKFTNIPVHVLIRPRFGDFCYDRYEASIIEEDIKIFRQEGVQGVVIGALMPDGSLDLERLECWVRAAEGLSITLHRAFDVCRDPYKAYEEASQLGIHTILTSGQEDVCTKGIPLLERLNSLSREQNGRPEILVGSGVTAEAIKDLYKAVHICSYHMSGKVVLNSRMKYRRENVAMGLPAMSEYKLWETDEAKIREAVTILEEL